MLPNTPASRRFRPRLAGVLACTLLLAATACDDTDAAGSGGAQELPSTEAATHQSAETSAGQGSATSTPPAPPATEPDPSTREPSEPAPEEPAAQEVPDQCIVGVWLADNEYFLALMQELGDEIDSVTGRVLITFTADGTLHTEYEDWLITAFSDGDEMTIHRDGTDEGEYSVADGLLSMQDTSVGSVTTVSASGFEMVLEPEPASHHSVGFTCSPENASVTTPEGELRLSRLG